MLVVTRRQHESISMLTGSGELVKVTVKRTRLGSCQLVIDAPQTVKVLRDDAVKKQPKQLARCE